MRTIALGKIRYWTSIMAILKMLFLPPHCHHWEDMMITLLIFELNIKRLFERKKPQVQTVKIWKEESIMWPQS